MTDGRHFIQSIFTAQGELKDCEYIRRKDIIVKFLATFADETEHARLVAAGLAGASASPSPSTDASTSASAASDADSMRNATFEIVTSLPEQYASFMNYKAMKRTCRKYHKEIKRVAHKKKHGNQQEKTEAEAYITR